MVLKSLHPSDNPVLLSILKNSYLHNLHYKENIAFYDHELFVKEHLVRE